MPILHPSNAVFANIDVIERPIELEEVLAFDVSNWDIVTDRDLANWRATQAQAVYAVSRRIFGGEIQNFGIPMGPSFDAALEILSAAEAAQEVFREFAKIIQGQALKALKEAMRQVLKLVLDALGSAIDTISWVPAYGWLVEAVWDFAMGIWNLVQMVKRQNMEPKVFEKRQTYSPGLDIAKAHDIQKSVAVARDLTWIFRPATYGRGPGLNHFSMYNLEPPGSRWKGISGANPSEGGLGYCPWTTTLHRNLEIAPHGNTVLDTGRYMGSTRGVANVLNGLITSNTDPILFSVDAERILKEWEQYMFEFRVFIKEADISNEAKSKIVKWLGSGTSGPMFGWKPFREDEKLTMEDLGILESAPSKYWRTVRKRQEVLLNTTSVAYLDRDFAVFDDRGLLNKWQNNRDLLLKSQARCGVDLENIPDGIYRALMENAVSPPNCLVVGGLVSADPVSLGDIKLPDLPPVPPPRSPAPRKSKPSSDGIGRYLPAAAVGASGLLGWYLLSRAKIV